MRPKNRSQEDGKGSEKDASEMEVKQTESVKINIQLLLLRCRDQCGAKGRSSDDSQ